ncbi:MAG: hypothetical protein HOV79_16220 [Hamadaea sp.]|nr:hypothetical protein [Hamadaea sp.]
MLDENEFRSLLDDADVPVTGVDVARVLRTGRRGIRRRRLTVMGAGLAVLVSAGAVPVAIGSVGRDAHPGTATTSATPSPSGTPRSCTVQQLAMPAEYQSWKANTKFVGVSVSAADPTGRYIGGHAVIGQNFIPVLWTDGVPKVLAIDKTTASIDSISEQGVVAGMYGGGYDLYRYHDGEVTRLKAPAGKPWVYPWAISNAAGDITMNAKPDNAPDGVDSTTVVARWAPGSPAPQILPLPLGAQVRATVDDGRVIGTIRGQAAAYVWDRDGRALTLTPPAGEFFSVRATRGDWVTGGVGTVQTGKAKTGQLPTVMLWNLRTGESRRLPAEGVGADVNAAGWVITDAHPRAGAVIIDGVSVSLTAVASGGRAKPVAIADDGSVYGNSIGKDEDGYGVPVMWRC